MSISTRIMSTILVSLIALLFVGGAGLWELNQAQSRFHYVQVNTFPSLDDMNKAKSAITTVRIKLRDALLAINKGQRDQALEEIDKAEKTFDDTMADYLANNISNDQDKQLLDADKAAMVHYQDALRPAIGLVKAGKHDDAVLMLNSDPVQEPTSTLIKALTDHYKFNTDLV